MIGGLAAVYPFIDRSAQQPISLFVVPIIVVAGFGSAVETLAVSALALVAGSLEAVLASTLSSGGIASRMMILASAGTTGVIVAHQRAHRVRQLERAQDEVRINDVFQRSLVPAPTPPDDVNVQVRYIPGDDRMQLGGDFFDAQALTDGSLVFAVGDVSGHGPRAAALGADMRAAFVAVVANNADPQTWLPALNRACFQFEEHSGNFVTLAAGRFVPGTNHLDYVSAGHPWPIVSGRKATMLRPAAGPPLGVQRSATWATIKIRLAHGDGLLIYTDGLFENSKNGRQRTSDRAVLQFVAASDTVDLDALIDHFGPEGFSDDVALMLIEPMGTPVSRGGRVGRGLPRHARRRPRTSRAG